MLTGRGKRVGTSAHSCSAHVAGGRIACVVAIMSTGMATRARLLVLAATPQ